MRTTWASGGLSVAFPALTGLLLLLAYPPYDLSALAWCALVPLLWCVFLGVDEPRDSRPLSSGRRRRTGVGKGGRAASSWDRAVTLAWVGGLVWGIGLFYPLLMIREGTWVERVGGTAIIALLTATMLSLFYAAAVRITSALAPGRRWLSIPLFASLWVCLEYLIRAVAVGFSTYLGVTQWRVPALLGVASIGGIYAVTWLIVAANTAIAALSLPAVQKVLGRQSSAGPRHRAVRAVVAGFRSPLGLGRSQPFGPAGTSDRSPGSGRPYPIQSLQRIKPGHPCASCSSNPRSRRPSIGSRGAGLTPNGSFGSGCSLKQKELSRD